MNHDQYFKHKLFFPHLKYIRQYTQIFKFLFFWILLSILMKKIRFCALKLQSMYLKVYKTRKSGCYASFISSLGPTGPEGSGLFVTRKTFVHPMSQHLQSSVCHKNLHFSLHQKNLHFSIHHKNLHSSVRHKNLCSFICHKNLRSSVVHHKVCFPSHSLLSITTFAVHHKVCCPSQSLQSITKFAVHHKVCCLSQSFLSVIKSSCYQSFCGFPCSGFCCLRFVCYVFVV